VQPLSKWMPSLRPSMSKNEDPNEQRGVFVDEFTVGVLGLRPSHTEIMLLGPSWGQLGVSKLHRDASHVVADACLSLTVHRLQAMRLACKCYLSHRAGAWSLKSFCPVVSAVADTSACTALHYSYTHTDSAGSVATARVGWMMRSTSRRPLTPALCHASTGWWRCSVNQCRHHPIGGTQACCSSCVG
jgi:hypothetical protein